MTNFQKGILFAVLLTAVGFAAVRPFDTFIANAQQTSTSPKPTPTPTPIEDDEIIKIDTEVVNVLFTAQDKSRRMVTDLKQSEVRILENGQPQEIVEFSKQVDLPMRLSILKDTNLSNGTNLPEKKDSPNPIPTTINPSASK